MRHRLFHPGAEIFRRRIRIRVIQEIGDELLRLVLGPHMGNAPVELARNRKTDSLRLIIRTDGAAEYARLA